MEQIVSQLGSVVYTSGTTKLIEVNKFLTK